MNSVFDFAAAGWTVPSGTLAPNYVNHHNFYRPAGSLQWFYSGGGNAAYEHTLPIGTTHVLAAWAGFKHMCTMSVYDGSGGEVFSYAMQTWDDMANVRVDNVGVDCSAGEGMVRFRETGNGPANWGICWTFYVLTSTTSGPSLPPSLPLSSQACGSCLPPPPPHATHPMESLSTHTFEVLTPLVHTSC